MKFQTMGSSNKNYVTCNKCGTRHNKNVDCMTCRYGDPKKEERLMYNKNKK